MIRSKEEDAGKPLSLRRIAAARVARLVIRVGLCVAGALACRGRDQPPATSSRMMDTGQVLERGSSRYSVITRESCPGHRIVNTRFEVVAGLIVRITEDNTFLDCVEGAISTMSVLVWRDDPEAALIDSIHNDAERGTIVDARGNADRAVPLLEAFSPECCGSPPQYEYWNLQTGKLAFTGETPIVHFGANGTVRFLAVVGGSRDTVGTVEYGTGDGESQRVVFTRSGRRGGETTSDVFVVDSVALAGPRGSAGGVVVGRECCARRDTVPVSGVTLHVRLRAISGDPVLDFAASIVNDRLVLGSASRRR